MLGKPELGHQDLDLPQALGRLGDHPRQAHGEFALALGDPDEHLVEGAFRGDVGGDRPVQRLDAGPHGRDELFALGELVREVLAADHLVQWAGPRGGGLRRHIAIERCGPPRARYLPTAAR
ncbi:hypothetical protein D3C86_1535740 [compost metagenome]